MSIRPTQRGNLRKSADCLRGRWKLGDGGISRKEAFLRTLRARKNTAQVHKFHVSIAPNAGLHKVLFQ